MTAIEPAVIEGTTKTDTAIKNDVIKIGMKRKQKDPKKNTMIKILKTESNDQKIKKEKQKSIKSNLESSKPKSSTNLNDSVEITGVKGQEFCNYRKILHSGLSNRQNG